MSATNTDLIQLSVVVSQVDSIIELAERSPNTRIADPTQLGRYLEEARDLEYQTADDVENALPSITDPKSASIAQEAVAALRAFGDFSAQRLDDGTIEHAAGQVPADLKRELVDRHQRAKKASENLRRVIWDVCAVG